MIKLDKEIKKYNDLKDKMEKEKKKEKKMQKNHCMKEFLKNK